MTYSFLAKNMKANIHLNYEKNLINDNYCLFSFSLNRTTFKHSQGRQLNIQVTKSFTR